MYEKTTTVINATGLHARPAAAFIKCAKGFASQISVRNLSANPPAEGNAKSLLSVMKLSLTKDTPIAICAEGEDEQAAVDALIALVESGCGEEAQSPA